MSNASAIKGIMSKEFSAIRCLDFNGSTDYVDCGNNISLRIKDQSWTVEYWFNTIKGVNNYRIPIGITGYGGWYIFTYLDSYYFRMVNTDGTAYDFSSYRLSIDNNRLIHAVFAVQIINNDMTIKTYKNRVLCGSQTRTLAGIFENANPLQIWKNVNKPGLIGGTRIYSNKALNLTEIKSNFNGKITQDGLVAEWLMREQQGNTIFDTSENSNDGTIHGADWYEEKFNTPLKGIMSNSSEIKGIMTAEYS